MSRNTECIASYFRWRIQKLNVGILSRLTMRVCMQRNRQNWDVQRTCDTSERWPQGNVHLEISGEKHEEDIWQHPRYQKVNKLGSPGRKVRIKAHADQDHFGKQQHANDGKGHQSHDCAAADQPLSIYDVLLRAKRLGEERIQRHGYAWERVKHCIVVSSCEAGCSQLLSAQLAHHGEVDNIHDKI